MRKESGGKQTAHTKLFIFFLSHSTATVLGSVIEIKIYCLFVTFLLLINERGQCHLYGREKKGFEGQHGKNH